MTEKKKHHEHIVVTPRENSEVEITGAFPEESVAHYRTKALLKLGKNIHVPGFRQGHIPEKIVVEKVGGEQAILHEAAEIALAENYPAIVVEHGLKVIGAPHATITKLASGNPIEWKITTAVMPDVSLPDYRALARNILAEQAEGNVEVTDKEVDNVILQLRENKWRIDHKDADPAQKPKESELPELTLETVKTFGNFESLDDFKTKLKENIALDKKQKVQEKRRGAISEKLITETKVSLPRIFVESELAKMLAQFKHDVAAVGMSFEEYLKKIKKTEEDLRKEWAEDARKRATLQLALSDIAEKENITAPETEITKQTSHILSRHKDAKEDNVRIYVTTLLQNEAVFRLLES